MSHHLRRFSPNSFTVALLCGLLCYPSALRSQESQPNSDTTLVAGELMLQGTVQSAATGNIILRASSFTLPGGKTAAINPVKPKTIAIAPTATIEVRDNPLQKVLVDELKEGVSLLVIGTDSGTGKAMTARRILVWDRIEDGKYRFGQTIVKPKAPEVAPPVVIAEVVPPVVKPVDNPATVPPTAPARTTKSDEVVAYTPRMFAPPVDVATLPESGGQQTIDGIRLHVRSLSYNGHYLYLGTSVGRDVDGKTTWLPWYPKNTRMRIFGPDGNFVRETPGESIIWTNPNWSHISAEILINLPNAPAGVNGDFEEELVLKDVRIPRKFNEPVELDQVLSTKRGTQVHVKSLVLRTREDAEGGVTGALEIRGRITASPSIAKENSRISSTLESTDATWKSQGTYSIGFRTETDDVNLWTGALPPAVAQGVNVKFKVVESAPQDRDPLWTRKFFLNLKMPVITPEMKEKNRSRDALAPPTTAVVTGVVRGEFQDASNKHQQRYWSANIWLRDDKAEVVPGRYWTIASATALESASGREIATWPKELQKNERIPGYGHTTLFWKANGEPVATNERTSRVAWEFPEGARPESMDVEVSAFASQEVQHIVQFEELPIPAEGTVSTRSHKLRSTEGADIEVYSILHRAFKASGTNRTSRELLLNLSTGPASPHQSRVELMVMPVDERGNDMKVATISQGGTTRVGNEWRVVIADFPSTAKSFSLRTVLRETNLTGESATLKFRQVSLVPVEPPPSAAATPKPKKVPGVE